MKNILQVRVIQFVPWTIVLSISLMLMPCVAQAVCLEDDTKTEVVCSDETLGLQYGDHTSGCAITPEADIDSYQFTGTAGDPVRFICSGLTKNLDCRIEVWEPLPAGTKIVDINCSADGYSYCSIAAEALLPSTGTYDMAISDAGSNNAGNYSFNIEELPPDDAENLGYDATQSCTVSPQSDVDKFNFEGVAGTNIRIVATGLTKNLDSHIEVWDPNGNKIDPEGDVYCGADGYSYCSVSTDISLPVSGIYAIAVSDYGYNNTGNYNLQLQCLTGLCPLCTDSDNDGYGDPASPNCTNSELDCDDTNPAVHPGATEICENGLDDDCVGGDQIPCPGPCAGGTTN